MTHPSSRFDWQLTPTFVGVGISVPAEGIAEDFSSVSIRLGEQGRTFAAHALDQDAAEAGPLGYGFTPGAALRSMSRGLSPAVSAALERSLAAHATIRLERHCWTVDVILEKTSAGWSARLAAGRYDPSSPSSVTAKGESAEEALLRLSEGLGGDSHWRSVIADAVAVVRGNPHWL